MLTGSAHVASRKGSTPERILALSEKASELFSHQRYGEAAKYCDIILSIDPSNAKALEEREFALMRCQQYAEMISRCDLILKDRPDNVNALSDMGLGLIMTKRIPEGDKVLDRALAHDPEHIPTMWRKALARSNLNKYKQAISWLDRALAISPDSSLAHKRKGDALSNLGRYSEALPFYDTSLTLRPDSSSTLKAKARALHKLGRSDESLACCRNAWKADPEDRGAFLKFVRLLLETKRYEKVILYCDRVLNAEPSNVDMLVMKSTALSKLGRNEIVDYRDAILDVTPWNMDMLWTRGAGSQITGYADVSDYCDAILKDQPWNLNVLWKKGVALSQLKDAAEVSSSGRTGMGQAKSGTSGSMVNSPRKKAWPILIPDTNILYACCMRGDKNHQKALYLWNRHIRTHACYAEYTVLAEMRKLLPVTSDRGMWERMQSDMIKSFKPDRSAFFRLVSGYSKIRDEQVLDIRQFYADMLDHPGMSNTIKRWRITKKDNPVAKEKGAQALLKNYPDNNILAFAAFCARETGAPTTLLSQDSDFLYFAEQIWSRFNVKVTSAWDAPTGRGKRGSSSWNARSRKASAHPGRSGRNRRFKRKRGTGHGVDNTRRMRN